MTENPTPASTAPLAAGLPLVRGRCPACGTAGLFLGSGGYVTCSRVDCPEPDAATAALERGKQETPVGRAEWDALVESTGRLRERSAQIEERAEALDARVQQMSDHLRDRANAVAAELHRSYGRIRELVNAPQRRDNEAEQQARSEAIGLRNALGILVHPAGSSPSQQFIEHVGDNYYREWVREQQETERIIPGEIDEARARWEARRG
ncbi:hypothetical protein ACFW9D_05885 [Streptomyces sp. NPDC059524]|uniref:hypothetical protein n=1 Tax=Streptomyces sp. NPDC059524 TaxID=3346856 RepID=UPI0036874855